MKSKNWTIEDAKKIYHIQRWCNGYFDVNQRGHLEVMPKHDDPTLKIDLQQVIEQLKAQGTEFPVVIRFLDILHSQVDILNTSFADCIAEAGYQGRYTGVYPIKVNQPREVVEKIVKAGSRFDYGLEAGSKSELLAVLAYNNNPNALTILNGYKDREYLQLALAGKKMGRRVVVVIDKYSELESLLALSREM